MREATATPSEVHVPPPAPSSQSQARKNPHSAAITMGSTPETTQDPSSETEMVNYSSGEDEPGIHECIIVYSSSVGRTTRINNFRTSCYEYDFSNVEFLAPFRIQPYIVHTCKSMD